MSRAVSTVVDVGFCLVLLGAAVGVVITATPPTADVETTSHDVATTLGSTTTTVTYDTTAGGEQTHHGTLPELLAAAAVANASVDGGPPIGEQQFVDETVAAVDRRRSLAAPQSNATQRVQLRAVWSPAEDAAIHGEVVVGDKPADDADVHATTLVVPAAIGHPSTYSTSTFSGGTGDSNANQSVGAAPVTRTETHRANESMSTTQASPTPTAMANDTMALWFPRTATRPLSVNRTAPSTVARLNRAQHNLVDSPDQIDAANDPAAAYQAVATALEARYTNLDNEQVWTDSVEIVVRSWDPVRDV